MICDESLKREYKSYKYMNMYLWLQNIVRYDIYYCNELIAFCID